MPEVRRKIGLSLGADVCWPICYEQILDRLDLTVKLGGDSIRFDVERVKIEPFYLRQPTSYDVVIDRLTHWYGTSREWIKKAILLDGLYVFNNPWSIQSNEKHTSYCAMMRLGMRIPTTWMVPPKEYEPKPDLQVTLDRYAEMFDLDALGEQVGYPMYIKPYDGGGWAGVSRIENGDDLQRLYDESGTYLMHLQQAVDPHDLFIRCIGLGPQVRVVRYDPGAPLHNRYTADDGNVPDDQRQHLIDTTLTINSFFGWDFNSCEALRQDGTWYPIDFANPCPDSQVTSLHYHFPWLIGANLRWSLFCAATKRPVRPNMDWQPYFDIADSGADSGADDGADDGADGAASYEEKLDGYAAIARERLQADAFDEFCATHLGALDEVLHDFFGTDEAKDAIHQKVVAMYPEHEVDEFTELFWSRIQDWRRDEG